jgi:hypothetical protein
MKVYLIDSSTDIYELLFYGYLKKIYQHKNISIA